MSAIDGDFTVEDAVMGALLKAGIASQGIAPSGTDVLNAQNDLSDMMAQWNVKTWLTFDKLDLAFVSDGRDTPYTVGPGGNYASTPRPDRIEAAYLRILANTVISGSGLPVDQPLKQIPAREQYANVSLKSLVAFPKAYFYDTASPLGNLFIYPWPQANLYETHIIIKNVFPLLLPLNLDLSMLPPEVRPAMKFCLAQRIRQAYGKAASTSLDKLARDALATMRYSHIQVPELTMPAAVLGRGSLYNIYGDNFYAILASIATAPIMWHLLHLGGIFT